MNWCFFVFFSGCTDTCFKFQDNYLAWEFPGSGKYFCFMAIHGALFFIILFLFETGVLQKQCASLSDKTSNVGQYSGLEEAEAEVGGIAEDDDVRAERDRINTTEIRSLVASDSIVIKNLKKKYDSFLAVDEICVSVTKQECFGLLGQNGAGKTSTFKMLTGDVIPTSGNAWMNGHDIQHEMKTVCILHSLKQSIVLQIII